MPNPIVRKYIKGVGIKPFDFNPALATFTPSMAKRTTSVFNASPIVQGNWDGTGVPDSLYFTCGTQIASNWYANLDPYQGSIVFWITPEWNGNDGLSHTLFSNTYGRSIVVNKASNNNMYVVIGTAFTNMGACTFVAGTTYCVVVRWDIKNKIDGTNYFCLSTNDIHSFAGTISPNDKVPSSSIYVGSDSGTVAPANAIIQGLTVYRRVLTSGDGIGTNVGVDDEINLIYAAGTGKDPTLVTGSDDVVFSFPTNGTAGALVTGTGEAWSSPHGSNLLTQGWLNDGFYGGGDWAVKFNGSTTKIDCGSDAGLNDLADAEMTIEGWFNINNFSAFSILFQKGYSTVGWNAFVSTSGTINAVIKCDTTDSIAYAPIPSSGKHCHVVLYFNDAGGADRKARLAVNGVWAGFGNLAVGAIKSDATKNLLLGGTVFPLIGSIGWCRISNNARYTPGTNFLPSRTPPTPDANTLAQWNMDEGTGVTVDNVGTIGAGADGTITAGTWERQWNYEGSPIIPKSVEFNGASTVIDCSSDAKLDNLADGAISAEVYARITKTGLATYLLHKGSPASSGWNLSVNTTGKVWARVMCATTNPIATSSARFDDGKWHVIGFTFDDAGDRKIRLYVDRVLVSTSVAAVGAIISDAANSLYVGGFAGIRYVGAVGWVRISNVVRDIPAETYTRETPPADDANTALLLKMDEGVGNPVDSAVTLGAAATCTLTSGVWNYTPDMATDSPGARIYNWGYVFGSGAVDSGFKQTISVTAGDNFSLRALAYSEDGVGQPAIEVYDEDNATTIVQVLGTATSLEWKPDVMETCFQAPVGCSNITIMAQNHIGSGTVGFHQIEVY